MNENLNLVEILKDCPKGTKLYSPSYGDCGYLGDEELDGYGDTPLEAVYNCFVNCVKCKVIS